MYSEINQIRLFVVFLTYDNHRYMSIKCTKNKNTIFFSQILWLNDNDSQSWRYVQTVQETNYKFIKLNSRVNHRFLGGDFRNTCTPELGRVFTMFLWQKKTHFDHEKHELLWGGGHASSTLTLLFICHWMMNSTTTVLNYIYIWYYIVISKWNFHDIFKPSAL